MALTHHPTWWVVVTPDPLPPVGAQQPEVGALYLNPKHSTRMDNVTSPITEMVDNPPVMRAGVNPVCTPPVASQINF